MASCFRAATDFEADSNHFPPQEDQEAAAAEVSAGGATAVSAAAILLELLWELADADGALAVI